LSRSVDGPGGLYGERRGAQSDLADRNQHLRTALVSLAAAHGDLQRTVERLRRTESQLLQSEKMRALGQFVAGIAHELNNPIGFVAANLEYVRRAVDALAAMFQAYARVALPADVAAELAARRAALRVDSLFDDLPSALDDCEEGTRRSAEIVAALRAFAQADRSGTWSTIDLNERLERTLALLRHRLGSAVQVVRELGAVPAIECAAGEIDQVLLNLLAMVDALGARGPVRSGRAPETASGGVQAAGHNNGFATWSGHAAATDYRPAPPTREGRG
jgi:signal transduction histidine kinase